MTTEKDNKPRSAPFRLAKRTLFSYRASAVLTAVTGAGRIDFLCELDSDPLNGTHDFFARPFREADFALFRLLPESEASKLSDWLEEKF